MTTAKQGIALLEVLLAISIIGIGLATVYRSLGSSAGAQSLLQDRDVARRLTSSQIARFREGAAQLSAGEQRGEFSEGARSYRWSATFTGPTELAPYWYARMVVRKPGEEGTVYATSVLLPSAN